MTYHYDDQVTQTKAGTRAALEAFEAAGPGYSLPAWLRLQSWRRLADAQRDHLHWWFSHTRTAASCTCGLVAELPTPPVHEAPGHRDPNTWRPTSVLVIPAGVVDGPRPPGSWTVVCQTCGLTGQPMARRCAVAAHDQHRSSCPLSRSRQDHP